MYIQAVSNQLPKESIMPLFHGKKRYAEGVGFPRFKSWKRFDSFTYSYHTEFSFAGKNNEKGKSDIYA